MTRELDTAAAAIVTNHAFVPRGEWYERCGHVGRDRTAYRFDHSEFRYVGVPCGLAEAAHAATTLSHPRTVIDHEGTT
jgi:hypothetical protein